MRKKTVSVIIPFKNQKVLPDLFSCVKSLLAQTVLPQEIIIIGSSSQIPFPAQGKKLIKLIPFTGDKNEARNLGISRARGNYILYLDHDMITDKDLIKDCIALSDKYDVIIIPERGEGGNFWANCRKLEKKLIAYDLDTVTPRFFKKDIFKVGEMPFDSKFGLLDEWGFNVKIKSKGVPVGISNSFLTVSEKDLSIEAEVKNKFLRGLWMKNFYKIDRQEAWRRVDPVKRGLIFYTKNLHYLLRDPLHFIGLLMLKSIDLTFFLLGYLFAILGFEESYPKWMIQISDNYGNLGEKYLTQMYTGGKWNQYVDRVEKREISKLWKLNVNNNVRDQKLLDLGMGPGRWSKFFLEYGFESVTGVDISKEMVKFARSSIKDKRFTAHLGDMSILKFPDSSFDKVFCFRAFKYVPDYKAAIGEMIRVLGRGGKLIFEVPNQSLINRVLKFLSFFVVSVNKSMRDKTFWGYFNNVTFFSRAEISKVTMEYPSLKLLSVTPLFILPSIKFPNFIDKYGTGALIFVDKVLLHVLPKSIFARSWIVSAKKL